MKTDKTLQKQAQEILQALEANGVDVSKYKGLAESLSKKFEDEKERQKERQRLYRRKDSQLSPEELEARQKIRQARKQAKEQREKAEKEKAQAERIQAQKIEEYNRAISIEKSAQTLNGITDLITVIENERTAVMKNNALTSLNSLLGELTEIAPEYLAEEKNELKKAKTRAQANLRRKEKKERLTSAFNSLSVISKLGASIPTERARQVARDYQRNYYMRNHEKLKARHLENYYLKKEQQQ